MGLAAPKSVESKLEIFQWKFTNCVWKKVNKSIWFSFFKSKSSGGNWYVRLLAFLANIIYSFIKLIQVKVNSKIHQIHLISNHLNFILISTSLPSCLNLINLNHIRNNLSKDQTSTSSNQRWLQWMIYQSSSYLSSLNILGLLI